MILDANGKPARRLISLECLKILHAQVDEDERVLREWSAVRKLRDSIIHDTSTETGKTIMIRVPKRYEHNR